jgi:hypothetical protein
MIERRSTRTRRTNGSEYLTGYRAGQDQVRSEYQRWILWFLGITLFGVALPLLINHIIPNTIREDPSEDKVGFLTMFIGASLTTLGSLTQKLQEKYLGDISFLSWGSFIGGMLCIPTVMFAAGNSLNSYGVPFAGFALTVIILGIIKYNREIRPRQRREYAYSRFVTD